MVIFNADDTVTMPTADYLALSTRAAVNVELEHGVCHAHTALFGPPEAHDQARQEFAHAVRTWATQVRQYRDGG